MTGEAELKKEMLVCALALCSGESTVPNFSFAGCKVQQPKYLWHLGWDHSSW